MSTIRDVAKQAGVSVATVSRVINNKGYVHSDTRKKIQKAIEKLNYRPNAVARSLYKKQTKTIGLIVPDISNPFFPQLARAVEDITNSQGYTTILCNSDEKMEKELAYLEMMEQKYVDGLILATNTLKPEQLAFFKQPIVFIDRPVGADAPAIVVDNRNGARLAVRHLQSIGCQVIAHLRGPDFIGNANERCQGYLDQVKDSVWFNEKYIEHGHYNTHDAYEVTQQLLTENPEIDGIFAANDLMAIGALKAAQNKGLKVPEDLAIVGFDGIEMCVTTSPEMTTIQQPTYEMGAQAASMLIDWIETNVRPEATCIEYPTELTIRGTSDRSKGE